MGGGILTHTITEFSYICLRHTNSQKNKQMKTRFLYLVCCLLTAFSFTCCNDEDDIRFLIHNVQGDIIVGEKAVDHISISNLGGQSVLLSGGTMPYTASVDVPSLLTLTLENDNLYLQATGEEGTVEVTITDKNGKSSVLTVVIRKERIRITATGIKTRIEGNIDEETRQAITEDIMQNARIQPDYVIYMERTDITEAGYEGILHIYASSSESAETMYEGTYKQGYEPDLQAMYFELTYNGTTELYFLGRPNQDFPQIPETRETSPSSIYLGRNLTSHYQALYPGVENVTMAIFGYSIP